jgi:outer membrane protein assembly factor BamB
MSSSRFLLSLFVGLSVVASSSALAEKISHRVLTQGNGNMAIIGHDGQVEWEMKWGGIHDIHQLPNGNIMVQEKMRQVVEIDPKTKKVVWRYDSSKLNGNDGQRIEVHAFQPLANGNVKLKVLKRNPHTDTRLVRKLKNGNYLACHESDGTVREYRESDGEVIWEYEVPMFGKEEKGGHGLEAYGNRCFSAVRMDNGNTLVATGNGHSVLEVTPEKVIVWQIHQDDLPGIRFAWVTTLEVLPNGNYVIGNCHAGPGNPLLVEVDPKTKKVVWTFDQFERFGNSVPNSQLLDVAGKSIR